MGFSCGYLASKCMRGAACCRSARQLSAALHAALRPHRYHTAAALGPKFAAADT